MGAGLKQVGLMMWGLFGFVGLAVFLVGCWEVVSGPSRRLNFGRVIAIHTKITYRDGCLAAGGTFEVCDGRATAYAEAGP